ncbi:MAG TPA: ABC transporter ATP-binding protein [Humibacter sp.]|nr:ABC transporter ATP-binding protein [Humibacter sp.]
MDVRTRPSAVLASRWGWRHAGRARWAVDDLDLRIEAGERILLLGASGSGKSTLLAALAGVLGGEDEGEERGTLLIDGVDPARQRGRSGLLMQDPDAQVVLARVGDDVAFGCENLGVGREEIWRRVSESLAAVGLDVPFNQPTSALSGGQKQRLALAGILAMRPGLLLLDEPTANLDPHGVGEVRDAVEAVVRRTGSTLVVVEHRVDVWRHLVHRVIVLGDGGRLLADGHPDAVLADPDGSLRRAGVWTSQRPPEARRGAAAPAHGGEVLLDARRLEVGRPRAPFSAGPVDLGVRHGAATVLTGANGSGKSTLALTLGGLIPERGGELRSSPELSAGAATRPIEWRSRQLLTRIGSVFQSPEHQFLAQSVRSELAVGPRALRLPQPEVTARVDELLVRLRLDALAEANPYTLSGGQKRRLSVATVLATRPKALILDEPTFGQDSNTWVELVGMLRDLRDAGHAVLAVSHDAMLAGALGASEWVIPAGGHRIRAQVPRPDRAATQRISP